MYYEDVKVKHNWAPQKASVAAVPETVMQKMGHLYYGWKWHQWCREQCEICSVLLNEALKCWVLVNIPLTHITEQSMAPDEEDSTIYWPLLKRPSWKSLWRVTAGMFFNWKVHFWKLQSSYTCFEWLRAKALQLKQNQVFIYINNIEGMHVCNRPAEIILNGLLCNYWLISQLRSRGVTINSVEERPLDIFKNKIMKFKKKQDLRVLSYSFFCTYGIFSDHFFPFFLWSLLFFSNPAESSAKCKNKISNKQKNHNKQIPTLLRCLN